MKVDYPVIAVVLMAVLLSLLVANCTLREGNARHQTIWIEERGRP